MYAGDTGEYDGDVFSPLRGAVCSKNSMRALSAAAPSDPVVSAGVGDWVLSDSSRLEDQEAPASNLAVAVVCGVTFKINRALARYSPVSFSCAFKVFAFPVTGSFMVLSVM